MTCRRALPPIHGAHSKPCGTLAGAISDVRANHCQRIAAPGQWKVWRYSDGTVRHEVLTQ